MTHAFKHLLFAGLMLAVPSFAGEPRKPSAEEIVNELAKPVPAVGLTRSFVPSGRGVSVEAATESVTRPSIGLEVNFEFNSAKLTTDAMLTLDQLGQALNDP